MKIDFNNINFYSPLVKDYINGNLKENNVIGWDYNIESVVKKTATRQFENRKLLVASLTQQNSNTSLSEVSSANIEKLNQENCFTVCTGHQLNIFGGPAYFYTKILDVINLSKRMNTQQGDYYYVPVFWMASEDHDFEEISISNLFNKKIKWDNDTKGPVGRMNTESIKEVYSQFKSILGETNKALELADIFEQAYCSGRNLADATRFFVNEIFKNEGLVILDGDDTGLKQLLTPVVGKEIKSRITESSVTKGINKISSYKIQAKPRSVNLFYLDTNYRERIVIENNVVQTADKMHNWTLDEFINISEKNPEKISPNVFLRPIYQELCLPNVAYVGGAGEISYWLELPELFKNLNIPFPVPVVRNSYLYLNQKQFETINKHAFNVVDFFKDESTLIKDYLERTSGDKLKLSKEKEELSRIFKEIQAKSAEIDKDLENVVKGELKRSLKSMNNMEKRFRNAEKSKKQQETASISKIKSVYFPNGNFQERTNSFFDFVLKSEYDLFKKVIESNVPFDNSIKVIFY
ncbi:MAG: bacillithiol biosynthesis cysteine-adding enzyme BshC [Glaciecola sp.]|jgi:bacillithiol biosynthesis cysteine-adding enzyme BshC